LLLVRRSLSDIKPREYGSWVSPYDAPAPQPLEPTLAAHGIMTEELGDWAAPLVAASEAQGMRELQARQAEEEEASVALQAAARGFSTRRAPAPVCCSVPAPRRSRCQN
jgi:hypothetical protein